MQGIKRGTKNADKASKKKKEKEGERKSVAAPRRHRELATAVKDAPLERYAKQIL